MEESVMHDVVCQQHHPLKGRMGPAGRSTAKKTLGTVAVRLAAAAVLTLVSVAPARAADDSVPGLAAPRLSPGALPYHLDVGRLAGTLGQGDLGVNTPTTRLVAQATAGTPAIEPDGPEESASELNR